MKTTRILDYTVGYSFDNDMDIQEEEILYIAELIDEGYRSGGVTYYDDENDDIQIEGKWKIIK